MKVLVTGSAGFIGFHLTMALLEKHYDVVGIDNINDYYDVSLKTNRLSESGINPSELAWNKVVRSKLHENYRFIKLDLEDKQSLMTLYKNNCFDVVINLAAQAGVRYSITNPDVYIQSNIVGFLNILEACRNHDVGHLVYASSSSVYGLNQQVPFSVKQNTDHPISLYAATKKANELMAHTYSHLYGMPTTGLRFFTVYGPWGRPDMACFLFADAILKGKQIELFNHGQMKRDFTYIDDIVLGILKIMDRPSAPATEWEGTTPDPSCSSAPYRIYNIGNNTPVNLLVLIHELEKCCGKKANLKLVEIQPGDVSMTWANIDDLVNTFNYKPETKLQIGIKKFMNWYLDYYYPGFVSKSLAKSSSSTLKNIVQH